MYTYLHTMGPYLNTALHLILGMVVYCKSGNIRGTLIFTYFAQIQQARIQKPAKIFAVPK